MKMIMYGKDFAFNAAVVKRLEQKGGDVVLTYIDGDTEILDGTSVVKIANLINKKTKEEKKND